MASNNPVIIHMNQDTIRNTILTNIIKMLSYRKWILSERVDKIINELIENDNDNMLYGIKLDVDLKNFEVIDFTENFNDDNGINSGLLKFIGDELTTSKKNVIADKTYKGEHIYIKIIPNQKIASIEKTPSISDFIKKYDKYHRILVVEAITEKPLNKILEHGNIEVFLESSLMINLVDHVLSPEYQVLTSKMIEQFKKDYKILNLHYIPIMFDSDPASKYLYLKKGQVVRITRRVKNTEISVGYRVIAKKTL